MKDAFDELNKMLNDVALNADKATKKLDSVKTIDELLTPKFMSKHTKYENFNSWLSSGGFKVDEFDNIPMQKLDEYVVKTTKFKSWEDMQYNAISEIVDNIF